MNNICKICAAIAIIALFAGHETATNRQIPHEAIILSAISAQCDQMVAISNLPMRDRLLPDDRRCM